ncbi:methyltransferase domain-containing protein [Pseudomonas sp. CLCA07]
MHDDTLRKKEYSEKIREMADSSFNNNKLQEAARLYELSIKNDSKNVKALNNFAALYEELGDKNKSERLYKLACALPGASEADKLKFHQNLASIQEKNGKTNAALWTYQSAAKIEGFTKSRIAFNYLDLLQSVHLTSFDAATFASLATLFNTEGIDIDTLTRVYFSQLALKFAKMTHTKEECAILILDIIESEQIALELLSNSLISNHIIEEAIITIRKKLIESILSNNYKKTHPAFLRALKKQCKLNDFIYLTDKEELSNVEKLKEKALKVSSTIKIDAQLILESYSDTNVINTLKSQNHLNCRITKKQNKEVTLPVLQKSRTLIQNFYESNPYPTWTSKPKHSESTLDELFIKLNLKQAPPNNNNILVAGCGTGRHAIQLALTYPHTNIIGLDVSKASLQYATRKREEYNIRNLEFIHGDLNNILSLNMRFSLIECIGVLHHLQDPLKGCQAILSALENGGIAKIGLYSTYARTPIAELANLASKNEILYTPSNLERIRDLSIQNYKYKRISEIVNSQDFFSRSGCMDLLFNPLEKTFTTRDIHSLIRTLNCEFAGFEKEGQNKSPAFRKFNEHSNLDSLFSAWELFENFNPNFFSEMYLFWLKPIRNHQ